MPHRQLVRMANTHYSLGFIKREYLDYIKNISKDNLIAVWPMNETLGTTLIDYSGYGRNGVYRNENMVNKTQFLNNSPVPKWTSENLDWSNIYSTSLKDSFLYTKGSLIIWVKVNNSNVWSDATNRTLFDFRTSVSGNIVRLARNVTNNRLVFTIRIGGVSKTPFFDAPSQTRNDWFMIALTWSDSSNGNSAKIYYNTVQQSTTQAGFGVASTPTLSSQYASLGNVDNNTPTEFWNGYLAYCSIWSNYVLTQSDINGLYKNRFLA